MTSLQKYAAVTLVLGGSVVITGKPNGVSWRDLNSTADQCAISHDCVEHYNFPKFEPPIPPNPECQSTRRIRDLFKHTTAANDGLSGQTSLNFTGSPPTFRPDRSPNATRQPSRFHDSSAISITNIYPCQCLAATPNRNRDTDGESSRVHHCLSSSATFMRRKTLISPMAASAALGTEDG
jgi:hypothetical protein